MTANQAARKVESLNGVPTWRILVRYGVPEREAKQYMQSYGRHRKKREGFLKKRAKHIVCFGHRTK